MNTNPRFCFMCRVMIRTYGSLISGYCLHHQLWVWNGAYMMETRSVLQFMWCYAVLCSCRDKGAIEVDKNKSNNPETIFNQWDHKWGHHICVFGPGSAIFHRNETSFGVARSYPNPCNKVASLQCSRLDVLSTHALLLPFSPPAHIHRPPVWLWPSSQWLVTVEVGPFKVGVSRTSPHCCFRDQKRPAMVPNEIPCFFCCASSESLCSSSCVCKNIHAILANTTKHHI